jgi:glycosyltransferase involved in cell wall biosynthesis
LKVTIIITTYNKADYLKESIDSALNQKYNEFDILIIDDGSTDDSKKIIEIYRNEPRVEIYYQENQGVIKTRNKAINLAKGAYILQLDGDDKIGENFLSLTVPILENQKEVGIVFCKTELFGEKSGVWERGAYNVTNQLTANLIVITALFRKIDFNKTAKYRSEFQKGLEDWDVWLSILELGLKAKEVPEIEFFYRVLNQGRNHSYDINQEKELKKMIFKVHSEFYIKNGLDSTNLLWEIRKLENKIKDLSLATESLEYRLGCLLLKPFRKLKKK